MAYEPSLRMVHAFLNPETRKALSLPLAALITGALSQVETTIELTNRVCDSVFQRSNKPTHDSGIGSGKTRKRLMFQPSIPEKRNRPITLKTRSLRAVWTLRKLTSAKVMRHRDYSAPG